MFYKKKINQDGITLLALVVTIIVLLILAGVAISLTIGNNGLFTRAENAANTWKKAEQKEMNEIENFTNTYDKVLNELELNGENTIKKAITEITGYEKQNIETIDSNGAQLTIPAGFKVDANNNTVANGLVIIDVSAGDESTVGNEFVWVPCTIDGLNNTLKYDRYAYTRDGWNFGQIKLDERDLDESYKIQREDDKSFYFHEQISKEEKISIEKYKGFYFRKI